MNRVIGIGIDSYQDDSVPDLSNCVIDVNRVIGALSNKYDVDEFELLSDVEQTTKSFIYRKLYDVFVNATEDDNILLLYSGHGEYNARISTSYWLGSDAKNDDPSSWLNVADILDVFKVSKAKHIALISDTCFSGSIFESEMRGGGISALDQKYSRQVLTSGSIEPVSDGKAGDHSPFTQSVLNVLESNEKNLFSFSLFSEEVIMDFSKSKAQTPMHGALARSGHKGGSYIFKLRTQIAELFRDVKLQLGMNTSLNIKSDISIPFINTSPLFDHDFLNAFIRQQGYAIINEARLFFQDQENVNKDSEFFLEVGYTIEKLDEKFLSIIISRFDYFGGAHPNSFMYTLNFAFHPERKISLDDLLDFTGYGGFDDFLSINIQKYGDENAKDFLEQYKEQLDPYGNTNFSFNDRTLTIYFTNVMPMMIKALGFLEIPLEALSFKL
jgi:hypothetical protein